jgi:hypothetical protein
MPARPRRVETAPSCTQPDPAKAASWADKATIRSKVAAYSRARRSTSALARGRCALLTATTPARLSAASSASCSPRRRRVRAPMVRTRTPQACSARREISSTSAGESIGGSVSGGTTTVVTPPRAAARVSLAMVALCSSPGSRRWADRSTRPGNSQRPRASIRRRGSKPAGISPSARISLPWMQIGAMPSKPLAGSITRAFSIRTLMRCAPPSPWTSPPCAPRCRR